MNPLAHIDTADDYAAIFAVIVAGFALGTVVAMLLVPDVRAAARSMWNDYRRRLAAAADPAQRDEPPRHGW